MAVSMIGPKFYAWDRNGKPLAFGKLYTYQARTNIPKPTYQSEDQAVENTNPVILNGEGYANVYLDGSYKMVLKDDKDNEIWSSDPVTSAQPSEWVNCTTAQYIDPSNLKVQGNQVEIFAPSKKVRLDANSSNYSYSSVLSSYYASGETFITLTDAIVTTGLEFICSSIVSDLSAFSFNDISDSSALRFKNVLGMKEQTLTNGSSVDISEFAILKTSYYSKLGYGSCCYLALSTQNYTNLTGLVSPDGIRDHQLQDGLVAMAIPNNGVLTVQQCGAIPYDDSQEVANTNRDAFRAAHLSLKSEWDARKSATTPLTWTTRVESGDYNLSNGYTVPKGMVSFCDSLGAARVKQLSGTADANPKLPTVTLGNVINGTAVETAPGLYVAAPPPKVHNLYYNPQNSNVAVDIPSVPGFTIGDLWIQADTCVRFGDNTGDGIVGRLFLEDSSSRGLVFEDCQNIVIDEVYTFLCGNPCIITGNPNNIDIGILQTNYSSVASLQTNDSTAPRNFKIGRLICNQNAQFGTFVSPIRLRSNSSSIYIDHFEAYNYNGYALTNETGLSNVVNIGTAVLKQQRSNDVYTQGTTAKGFDVQNCAVTIDTLRVEGLQQASIGRVRGAFASKLVIKSGEASTQVNTTELIEITNTSSSSSVRVTDFDNKTGKELYALQDTVEVTFSKVKRPFAIVLENTRRAIKIPVNRAGLYEFSVSANTNPAGYGAYRRVGKFIVSLDVFFNATFVWNAELTTLFKSAVGTGFVPALDVQIDLGSVGGGAQIAKTNSTYLVISLADGYASTAYQLEPILS